MDDCEKKLREAEDEGMLLHPTDLANFYSPARMREMLDRGYPRSSVAMCIFVDPKTTLANLQSEFEHVERKMDMLRTWMGEIDTPLEISEF
jgi:hypothetical protein